MKSPMEGIISKEAAAIVISSTDGYKTCCTTEYTKDNKWICGMNYITSVEEVLKYAEEHGLNIIFENMLRKKS
jgi:hypothetical protein